MPETNGTPGAPASSKSNATTSPEKPALETALAQIEILRGDFRNAITGLNQLADALKAAQREQKAGDKERIARERLLETARSALGVVAGATNSVRAADPPLAPERPPLARK
jgi:hypothetical protein